jgi:UDP-glucose 4-epimerase
VLIWIVGQGGLLGSALARAADSNPNLRVFNADSISWGNAELVGREFSRLAERFAAEAGDEHWGIIWAAGHATVSSSEAETAIELEALNALCHAVQRNTPAGKGSFFLSSSAGGVYAGSINPPFSVDTEPAPLSAYGRLKLAQEASARNQLSGICPVIIGRISNLYGPGQDLRKLQGLISALTRAAVTRKPINMFVSLDTIRDYIYADDAAAQILKIVGGTLPIGAPSVSATYVLASGQPVSLGYLINLVQDIARIKVPVALGAHSSAAAQSRDLRLIPTVTELHDQVPSTPLAVGVKNVYLDVFQRVQRASSLN